MPRQDLRTLFDELPDHQVKPTRKQVASRLLWAENRTSWLTRAGRSVFLSARRMVCESRRWRSISPRSPYRSFVLFLASVLVTYSVPVLAEPSAQDRAMAQSLFDQGRALMDAQRYDQACPKFVESHRLDPGGGTLLNLARCYELAGRTASAWSTYEEALAMARRDGRADRERHCRKKLATLEPRIAKVTISVPAAARIDGLQVRLGERSLREAAWLTPLALDPGEYEVLATAPDRRPWSDTLVMAPGDRETVEIPVLEANEPSPATQPPERDGEGQSAPREP